MREVSATISRFPSYVSRGGAHRLMRALDHQEVEWQFDVDDLAPVEDWLKEHPSASGFAILPEATRELSDTYYDTEDWRFYRAGYALRVRRRSEEHTSELQSRQYLVCRLLLEKKKINFCLKTLFAPFL